MIIDPAKDLNGERVTTRPAHCARCQAPVVQQRVMVPPEGFVKYGARGMCKRCYNHEYKQTRDQGAKLPPKPPRAVEGAKKLQWDREALREFYVARRRRVGADGTLDEFPALSGLVA